MEPIEVTASFDRQGWATPLSFVWQGHTFPVTATGRRWKDGENQHILVMVPGEKVYELIHNSSDGRWYMQPGHADQMRA